MTLAGSEFNTGSAPLARPKSRVSGVLRIAAALAAFTRPKSRVSGVLRIAAALAAFTRPSSG